MAKGVCLQGSGGAFLRQGGPRFPLRPQSSIDGWDVPSLLLERLGATLGAPASPRLSLPFREQTRACGIVLQSSGWVLTLGRGGPWRQLGQVQVLETCVVSVFGTEVLSCKPVLRCLLTMLGGHEGMSLVSLRGGGPSAQCRNPRLPCLTGAQAAAVLVSICCQMESPSLSWAAHMVGFSGTPVWWQGGFKKCWMS